MIVPNGCKLNSYQSVCLDTSECDPFPEQNYTVDHEQTDASEGSMNFFNSDEPSECELHLNAVELLNAWKS